MYIYYMSSMMFFMLSLSFFNLSLIFLIYKLNIFIEWNSFYLNSNMFSMYLFFDWMSMMFMFTVLIISSMIMLYSSEYMSHDNNNIRFFWTLLFFIISMMMMILSPNILSILIGWDGLGLTSYCLIIFYQSKSSFNSGMITMLINRIGDIFIIMSISLLINLGSFNLMNYNILFNNYILFFLMIAAFTKSAQFPFSSWLPAAMAAPTPVSSLVHSSTLVTAGIYMMIRFNNLMLNNLFMNFMLLTGLITMLMAGMSANFEFDLKKIIAYSTLSQLGLMMMMLSMKMINYVFFHLVIHAMFKSMMFMCSGIMIHSMNNYQDIRFMGLIKNFLPLTSSMFLISNFSLCGLPFYSGFYSKDLLLEMNFINKMNIMIYILLLISTMLTVMYSFRLNNYLMNNDFKFFPMNNINEIKMMNLSMLILTLKSMILGIIMNWILFNNIEYIFMFNFEKLIILMICYLGFNLMLKLFNLMILMNKFYFIKYFLGKMWFLYKFNYMFNVNIFKFSKFYTMIFDKGWSKEFFNMKMFLTMNKLFLFDNMNLNNFTNLILMLSIMTVSMFMFL